MDSPQQRFLARLALLATVVLAPSYGLSAPTSASESSFNQATDKDKAPGWAFPNFMSPDKSASIVENGNRFVRFTNDDITKVAGMERSFPLPAGMRFVIVSARMRTEGIKLGAEGWHEPRIAMRFADDAGNQVGDYPNMPAQRTDADWTQKTVELDVPAGATQLVLQPGLWLTAGTLDLDDVSVEAHASRLDHVRSKVAPFKDGFPIGQFEGAGANGVPNGWEGPSGVSIVPAVQSTRVQTDRHPDSQGPDVPASPAGKVLKIFSDKWDSDTLATTTFAVDSDWQELAIAFKMKPESMKLGPEIRSPQPMRWRQAGLHVAFIGADGKELTEGGGYFLQHPRDWNAFTTSVGVPDGAVAARVQVGLFWSAGTIYIDNLTIVPSTELRLVDATLSPELASDFAQKPAVDIGAFRSEISLNGLWKFVPASGVTLKEPKGFGYAKVPGAWNGDAVVQRGIGKSWLLFKGSEVAQAWYERPINIPANWDGRAVVLDLDRVSTDAVVYLDGQEMGQVTWPAGQVDLTPAIEPGVEQTLRIRVLAVDDKTEVVSYMGYLNEPKAAAKLDNRGLIGDGVKLLSRPRGGHVADVYVRPSTRLDKVDVDVELTDVTTAGPVTFIATMLDESGKVEKTFETTANVQAAPRQTVTVSWPWADPRLWDYRQPNRYTMKLSLTGAPVTDEYVQAFGFREFWIDGRDFYLNGTLYNLRPNNLQYGSMPAGMLRAGYNFAELWPDDRGRRGSGAGYDDRAIDEADRVGMPIAAKLMHMGDWASDIKKWESPEARAEYRRLMEIDLRRWRNNPSVVMWAHSSNVFQWTGDGEPRLLGQPNVSNHQEWERRRDNALQAIAMAKELDPIRPIYAHHGADAGEVYTSNFYLNFIPLQEREEWMAHWAKHGKMPFIAIEFGTPLYSSLNRDKDGYTPQGHSEPSLTEWMAVYLGHEAYQLEPTEMRKIFLERYRGSDNHRSEYDPHLRHNGYDQILTKSESFKKLQNLFYRNTWRSWRTMGVSGMGIPWHQTDPNAYPELPANNNDTLAWIAGPPGETGAGTPTDPEVPNFTRKDHNFAPGQRVAKQIVLINDARTPSNYNATWTVTIDDKQVAVGEKAGELVVGEKLFLPVEFDVPIIADARSAGTITLNATISDAKHTDSFPFTVFAPQPKASGRLAVFDPAGDTTKLLTDLGYEVVPWTTGQPEGDVAVIGRHTLSNRNVPPGDLDQFVKAGGRLIVFGQDNDWTRLSLGLRTAPHVSRRVFKVNADHPVTAGLENDDLRDWAGEGTLVNGYPHRPGTEWLDSYGWRWGNRGSVSSTPIEKPHHGSFRPILECEFDLAYTPLIEMDYGRGRITLCTLDLEARANGSDAAANKLAHQVMEHVRAGAIAPKADRVVYVGNDAGANLLDDLGVRYDKADAIDSAAGLNVLGEGADLSGLKAFINNGGKALVLPRDADNAPPGMTIEATNDYQGSITVPTWPEAAGISPADLHWKTVHDGRPIIAAPEGIEIAADGMLARQPGAKGGVAIYAQVDPTYLPADEKHYFRFTRWRQTRALSQLLANLGATFAQDAKFVALLQRPQQGYALAGEWDAQQTVVLPESLYRQWHSVQPISDRAKLLIAKSANDDTSTDGWQRVSVPAYRESYGPKWKWTDGETLFRKVIDLPDYMAGQDMFLSVGRVDETEETFVNGTSIGSSKSWLFPRGHKVPGHLLKPGKNVIVVRNWDEGIHGGMCGAASAILLRSMAADPGLYHADYLSDQVDESTDEAGWKSNYERWFIADNPYRYTRW
ncbi:MAG TPA: hypothetical protein VGN72_17425 [Tepidisphaeraceae bacterium]|jgi:beta-galactosidase|nr:hypothetical protein [Tepidisphaeraceae bacterium]